MEYTVIGNQAHSEQGDAYKVTEWTTFTVLGTVQAKSEEDAVEVMEAHLKATGKKYVGSVIVVPGAIQKLYDRGYIHV